MGESSSVNRLAVATLLDGKGCGAEVSSFWFLGLGGYCRFRSLVRQFFIPLKRTLSMCAPITGIFRHEPGPRFGSFGFQARRASRGESPLIEWLSALRAVVVNCINSKSLELGLNLMVTFLHVFMILFSASLPQVKDNTCNGVCRPGKTIHHHQITANRLVPEMVWISYFVVDLTPRVFKNGPHLDLSQALFAAEKALHQIMPGAIAVRVLSQEEALLLQEGESNRWVAPLEVAGLF